MGTRNLTVVRHKGKTVIAQYGQWDGYPTGQGETCVKFVKLLQEPGNLQHFRNQIETRIHVVENRRAYFDSIGCHVTPDEHGFITHADGEKQNKAAPSLSRDMAAEVLQFVFEAKNPVPLVLNEDFGKQGLFCEWAYVLDLDSQSFEVYKGGSKDLATGHWSKDQESDKNGYYPVTLVQSYPFDFNFSETTMSDLEYRLNE